MHTKKTVKLLKDVVKDAWGSLTPEQQDGVNQSDLAAAVLEEAAQGERDPAKLKKVAKTVVE